MQDKVLSPVEQSTVASQQDEFLTAILANRQIAEGHGQIRDCLQSQLKQNFLVKPSS